MNCLKIPGGFTDSGFTLIEVLVALVIVVASLTILAQGFTSGGRASLMASRQTTAVTLAEQKIAELEIGEAGLTTGTSGVFDEPDGFRFDVKIDADAAITGLYKATVTIYWKDRETEQSYTLVRLIRERPKRATQ